MYSVRLIMELRGLRHRDLIKVVPRSTLHNILTANQNVSKNTLERLEPLLKTNGNIQFLFALDRLHFLAEKSGITINTNFVKFPNTLPREIVNILKQYHPAFISQHIHTNSTEQVEPV